MRILITAGATREPIDPHLFVGQSDVGAWGVGAATAAAKAGHRVTLLLGAWDRDLTLDSSIRVHRFASSAELRQLLGAHQSGFNAILHACAMTPLRPAEVEDQRIETTRELSIRLEPTPDLLGQIVPTKREGQRLIGLRIGWADESHVSKGGIDAEIWQKAGDQFASPTWFDASTRISAGPFDADGWGRWVVERIEALKDA